MFALILLACGPGSASAQAADEDGAERRLITDRGAYDHRAPEDHAAEEALLWIPRSLLAPLWGIAALHRLGIRELLEPIGPPPSTPDAEEPVPQPFTVMPVVQLESDRSPAAGVHVSLRAGVLRLAATVQHWDDRRIEGWLRSALALGGDAALVLRGHGSSRADRVFHGFGPYASQGARSRYTHHHGGGVLAWRHRFFASSTIALSMRATHHRFGPSDFGDEPSLEEQVDPGALPPGFADGATVLEERFRWALDSRAHPRRAPSPGARVGFVAAHGADLEGDARWLLASADAAATVRLAAEHDLTVAGWAAVIEPLGATPPPFVEQLTLGGRPGRLAGFLRGRLVGQSAAVIHTRYRWGIEETLDAALHLEVGNAFGTSFEGIALDAMRLSAGVSVDSLADDAHRVGLLLAFATEPFGQGADVVAGHVGFFVGSPPR